MQINNIYDSYGNLTEIRQENGTLIWQLNSMRATGNPSQYTLGPDALTKSYTYYAWGCRRSPTDRTCSNVSSSNLIETGYSGHSLSRFIGKHIDLFGLINMNGRIYDPVTARFLNADPIIQSLYGSQSFNGYSYCLNNPLRYTDPQGYVFRRPEEITWIDLSDVYGTAERVAHGARHDDYNDYSYSAGIYYNSAGDVVSEREVMSSMTSADFALQITDPMNLKLDISSKGFYISFGNMTPQERIGDVGSEEFNATFSFTYTLQFVPYSYSVPAGGMDDHSNFFESLPISQTAKNEFSKSIDLFLYTTSLAQYHQTTSSTKPNGLSLNVLVKNNEFSRNQLRYSTSHLALNGYIGGWDARASIGNFSLSYGINYTDLSITFGYGTINNGIITGHTITNKLNGERALGVAVGVVAVYFGQFFLIPALQNKKIYHEKTQRKNNSISDSRITDYSLLHSLHLGII